MVQSMLGVCTYNIIDQSPGCESCCLRFPIYVIRPVNCCVFEFVCLARELHCSEQVCKCFINEYSIPEVLLITMLNEILLNSLPP